MAVATTYLEVLSLADMKAELRLPSAVTSLDATVSRQIRAAGNYVAERISLPLIRENGTWELREFPPDECPLDLPVHHITEITSVKYWTASASLRTDPDGEIPVADLGRLVAYERASHNGFYVYWPDGGWPDTLDNDRATVQVKYRRGLDPVPEVLQQAMILAVRDYFEGHRMVQQTSAIDSLLHSFVHRAHPQAQAELDHLG